MREVLSEIGEWLDGGETVALATVVRTWGSAPRREGAKMAMTPAGKLAGSVSGGCVEGAVFESAVETLESGRAQLLHFGVADETAWDVGLACGGQIEVFVEPQRPELYQTVRELITADEATVVATVIGGDEGLLGYKLLLTPAGTQVDPALAPYREAMEQAAREALQAGRPVRTTAGELEIFVDVLLPAPQLIMVGGVHIAVALNDIARTLGYRTVVIDPRRAFGSQERFPDVDRLIQAWPDKAFPQVRLHEATAVVMLTHDPKIDDPALMTVLDSPAFYVGALGSTRTHAKRRQRLLEAGVTAGQLERIHAPIGLDVGAQTPEEIAVAIMAEIIAARNRL